MTENKLGEILKENKRITKARLERMLENAPYSQVLHKLKNSKEEDPDHSMMQYAWSAEVDPSEARDKDIIVVDTVEFKTKSENQAAKKKSEKKTTAAAKSKPKASPKAKAPVQKEASVTKATPEAKTEKVSKKTTAKPKAKAAPAKAKSTKTRSEAVSKASAKKAAPKTSAKTKATTAKKQSETPVKKAAPVAKKAAPAKTIKAKPVKAAASKAKAPVRKQSSKTKSIQLDEFTLWLNSLKGETDTPVKTVKRRKSAKRKKDKIQNIIDNSIQERKEIATESLAKLYESQEYYQKAIDVYEELRLKFPEKSSFFASQIEKLKDKI